MVLWCSLRVSFWVSLNVTLRIVFWSNPVLWHSLKLTLRKNWAFEFFLSNSWYFDKPFDPNDYPDSKNIQKFQIALKMMAAAMFSCKTIFFLIRSFHLSFWNFLPKAESELTALCSFFFGLFIYLFFKMDALYRKI